MGKSTLYDRASAASRERLRRRFRPSRVRMLFVGESPPASGRFFYQADSGLYRAIRRSFERALPGLRDADFLQSFQGLGCYLVDLCGRPVDRLSSRERRHVCADGEVRLGRMIAQLKPEIIVTVVRSIGANAERARRRAKWQGPSLELPYPGRWKRHRIAFDAVLLPVLRQTFGRKFKKD